MQLEGDIQKCCEFTVNSPLRIHLLTLPSCGHILPALLTETHMDANLSLDVDHRNHSKYLPAGWKMPE
jgi:hypothetical protein